MEITFPIRMISYLQADFPYAYHKQEKEAWKAREADILSDVENLDIMLEK